MDKAKKTKPAKKKLSRPVKFTILTACLLLAVCGYAAAVKLAANTEDEEAGREVDFVNIGGGTANSISWEYEGKKYTLKKDSDGTWVREDDKDFAIEQDTAEAMAAAVSNITASRVIREVTDLDSYGLKKPQSRITLKYTSAGSAAKPRTIEILTGDLSEVSGEYYACIAGSSEIYMVAGDYLEYFACTADDLAAASDEAEE